MESGGEEQGGLSAAGKYGEGARVGIVGQIVLEATWVGIRFWGEDLGKKFKVSGKTEPWEPVSKFKVGDEGGIPIRFVAMGR